MFLAQRTLRVGAKCGFTPPPTRKTTRLDEENPSSGGVKSHP